jgi:hypothetical protein
MILISGSSVGSKSIALLRVAVSRSYRNTNNGIMSRKAFLSVGLCHSSFAPVSTVLASSIANSVTRRNTAASNSHYRYRNNYYYNSNSGIINPFQFMSTMHFSTDSANSKNTSGDDSTKKDEETRGGKMAQLWRRYGYLSIATYLGIYGLTLTSIFVAFEYDVFNAATFGYDAPALVAAVSTDIPLISVIS